MWAKLKITNESTRITEKIKSCGKLKSVLHDIRLSVRFDDVAVTMSTCLKFRKYLFSDGLSLPDKDSSTSILPQGGSKMCHWTKCDFSTPDRIYMGGFSTVLQISPKYFHCFKNYSFYNISFCIWKLRQKWTVTCNVQCSTSLNIYLKAPSNWLPQLSHKIEVLLTAKLSSVHQCSLTWNEISCTECSKKRNPGFSFAITSINVHRF